MTTYEETLCKFIKLGRTADVVVALGEQTETAAGWVEGIAAASSFTVAVPNRDGAMQVRSFEHPAELSLRGDAKKGPEGRLSLYVTGAFESELGLTVVAGRLVSAAVDSFSGRIVHSLADGPASVRPPAGAAGSPAASGTATGRSSGAPSPSPSSPFNTSSSSPAAQVPSPSPSSPGGASSPGGGPAAGGSAFAPAKPPRTTSFDDDDVDSYPEPGDEVVHFHFGECEVVASDGERIRLRQPPDGRVREVALSMLKIEAPTISPSGKRRFVLGRKR